MNGGHNLIHSNLKETIRTDVPDRRFISRTHKQRFKNRENSNPVGNEQRRTIKQFQITELKWPHARKKMLDPVGNQGKE